MNRLIALSLGACVCIGALFHSGCATVTRGTKDALVVETDPPGALVKVHGQEATTPCSFKLSRKFEGPVLITKDGYEPLTVKVTSHTVTAGGVGMAGNVLIGGIIGAGLDVATGATNSLSPNPIKVNLVKIASPAPAAAMVVAEPTKGTSPQEAAAQPSVNQAPSEPVAAAPTTPSPSPEKPAAAAPAVAALAPTPAAVAETSPVPAPAAAASAPASTP